MKTIVIKNMKNFSLVAIMMAAIIFAACSGEENIISTQPTTGTFNLIVNASKGDDAATRALSLDKDALKATWTIGDVVKVYNVTRSAELTGSLIAQSNEKSTTLRGTLTGTIAAGDKLKLKFLSPTYSSQDGTLAGIAATCDYAEATVSVTAVSGSSVTTSNATFTNQQSIVEFTLKDKATDAELNATSLTVNAGATTINVTPASATNVLYVAIPGFTSQNVSLSATASGTGYTYEKSGITLDNGKYYGFTVSMDAAPTPFSEPLTFEAKEAGATVTFTAGTSATNPIEYSTDGITWKNFSGSINLDNVGDKVSFRGDNAAYGSYSSSYSSLFSCTAGCYVYGNIMSLINSTGFATDTKLTAAYTFAFLFYGVNQIYSHPSKQLELPATDLTFSCYARMFLGCTKLTTAPELPATTLAAGVYSMMFYGCESLTKAPTTLPATSLTSRCYEQMFYSCTSLTTAPTLLATTLDYLSCSSMFAECTSLTTAPELQATTLAESCYISMFEECTSLTTAPELPATTLAESCYHNMFKGCTELTTAPALPATTLSNYCYYYMFNGCSKLTTAPKLPATTLASNCYGSMFKGCTSLTTAPELPATTLVSSCYEDMFSGCTSLNYVKCLATDISAFGCTTSWLYNVPSGGTFTKASSMTSWTTGSSGIPSGWTVENE